jgi:UDP-glucuronate 4-epimerase
MKVILTGAAGFIGMHTTLRLLARGDAVVGVDDLNAYYEVDLKQRRLEQLQQRPGFSFRHMNIADREAMAALFAQERPQRVVHLAAQPGVRYSLTNPYAYVDANVNGFITVLEGCRQQGVDHLVYASSSSVYGGNTLMPFAERHGVDHPVSLYAATKKANELMAHTYSHLFRVPTTGLRFFTVYGPWGRPDMAPFLFTRAILEERAIDVFNQGDMLRDFTYVDDIVEGVVRVLDKPATPHAGFDASAPDPSVSSAPYRIFNIGNSEPIPLLEFIGSLERALGRTARKNLLPLQPGEVPATSADTSALQAWVGFSPHTPLDVGVRRFIDWYKSHYGLP